MNVAKFALLLGVGLLSFLFVTALYVVWTRIVGLDPTLAQRCAKFSRPVRFCIAVGSGALLGTGSLAAPSVELGVAGAVMLAASTFAALMAFELVQHRQHARA
ncbi:MULTISPECIES: hypothetical protein [Halorussus]|uniref:hypothetical protein n=1 Tax=Halorussus TaxID=1070314 RepID=UPI00209E2318|nr:hypothetical protein [Halorussus vallis]USZ75910.1 hypothetical protein NGM07_00985 [Halorussus vallis]